MNHLEFRAVLDRQIEHMRKTLDGKAAEYATDEDRLHNFKISAVLTDETAEQALWGMQVKHITSIRDMVLSDEHYDEAVWDEKIGDAINYFVLLRALVFERAQNHAAELEAQMPAMTVGGLAEALGVTHEQFIEAFKNSA